MDQALYHASFWTARFLLSPYGAIPPDSSSDTVNPDPDNPNNNINTNTTNSAADMAKDVVIIFLAGVGVVAGLVLVVYLLAILCDHYCCCCPWFQPLNTGASTDVDQGPVSRRAGLWGLRRDERMAILEAILKGTPYKVNRSSSSSDAEMTDTGGVCTTRENETGNSNAAQEEEEADLEQGNGGTDILDDAQHETTCAICLSEYVEGELILTGTSCSHMFHKTCAFEWLAKQDHCPYCRKEMVTPAEMRATAEQVLGRERVTELSMWGVTSELMNPNNSEDDENGRMRTSRPPQQQQHLSGIEMRAFASQAASAGAREALAMVPRSHSA